RARTGANETRGLRLAKIVGRPRPAWGAGTIRQVGRGWEACPRGTEHVVDGGSRSTVLDGDHAPGGRWREPARSQARRGSMVLRSREPSATLRSGTALVRYGSSSRWLVRCSRFGNDCTEIHLAASRYIWPSASRAANDRGLGGTPRRPWRIRASTEPP